MSDFYTVLRRSLDRADAPDEEQRQEIYDRLRTVIVRKLDAHRPRLKDTEFRHRLVAFDDAVTRIEDEIAASFAAADDLFDGFPSEEAPVAAPDEDVLDETEPADADEEPVIGEEAFLFADESEVPADEYAAEEYDEPEEYAAQPGPAAYEPAAEAEANPQWTPELTVPPEAGEEEVAETAGPSTMWGSSAIDLAWDETTAQWHDPEEPLRPTPQPALPPPPQTRPDSEWDRRLQMALAEETVRNRGSAAAPEWIAAETDPDFPPEDSTFYEEGQWDLGGAPPDDGERPPEKGTGVLGAVTSRIRALSPGRLLRRGRSETVVAASAPVEAQTDPRNLTVRVEPGFEMPVDDRPPAKERRTSVRSIMIDDGEDAFAEETPRQFRARRDEAVPSPPEPPARRASRAEPTVPPARPSGRDAAAAEPLVRPVRPTAAPQPARLGPSRAQRNETPAARTTWTPPADGEQEREGTPDVTWPTRPAARRRSLPPPSPAEPMFTGSESAPQRARGRPQVPSPQERSGEQRNLAPAGNRAVRYLGSDLDEAADAPAPSAGYPRFAEEEDAPALRRQPAPLRNAPPEGRRLVYERTYGSQILKFGVIGAIVIVLAVCAAIFVPRLLGGDDGATGGATGEQGIVLFGGTDPLVFQTGPDNPVNFEGDTAGGLVRVASSAGGAARATIGPGISGGVEGRQVRIQLDVRSTPGRPASTLRLAYLRGNTLLEWRTVNVTGDFAIVDAIWTIPTGVASPNGDALLIAPGVPGDGTAVDIRRITMDVGG